MKGKNTNNFNILFVLFFMMVILGRINSSKTNYFVKSVQLETKKGKEFCHINPTVRLLAKFLQVFGILDSSKLGSRWRKEV